MSITAAQLWEYPLKSGRGNLLTSAVLTATGFQHDRRLIVVGVRQEAGVMLTGRRAPGLLAINASAAPDDSGWWLKDERNGQRLFVARAALQPSDLTTVIWGDSAVGLDAGDEAADFLSILLERSVRLLAWCDAARHSEKYQLPSSYADTAPLLVVSEASMAQACDWAGIAVDYRRFRANIIIAGVMAFAEERWQRIRIGEVVLRLVDGCPRCILTTRDPDTYELHDRQQPLRALAENHRNEKQQPRLGMNTIIEAGQSLPVRIQSGASIEVLD